MSIRPCWRAGRIDSWTRLGSDSEMLPKLLYILLFVLVGALTMGAPCAGPVVHTSSVGSLTIAYWQVAERRTSRTAFEYDFAAEVTNRGGDTVDLVAVVSSASPATQVLDDTLGFGALPAGESRESQPDTFTIRQDRTAPFQPSALVWRFMDGQLPPDPGPLADDTVPGFDVDADGVRDDLQRFIWSKYPDSANKRNALLQQARANRRILLEAPDSPELSRLAQQLSHAVDCVSGVFGASEGYRAGMEIRAAQLDTVARLRASSLRSAALSGAVLESNVSFLAGCEFQLAAE